MRLRSCSLSARATVPPNTGLAELRFLKRMPLVPQGVAAPVQYGPRITVAAAYLSHAQYIPEDRLSSHS